MSPTKSTLTFGRSLVKPNLPTRTPSFFYKNVDPSGIEPLVSYLRVLVLLIVLLIPSSVHASEVNLSAIAQIESSHIPFAINPADPGGAWGKYQITPVALEDYNKAHKTNYKSYQMLNPSLCEKVAVWLLGKRADQFIKAYKLPNTVKTRLVLYNAGPGGAINHFRKGKPLPQVTQQYLTKYQRLTEEKL